MKKFIILNLIVIVSAGIFACKRCVTCELSAIGNFNGYKYPETCGSKGVREAVEKECYTLAEKYNSTCKCE